jgi:hypothetical protein
LDAAPEAFGEAFEVDARGGGEGWRVRRIPAGPSSVRLG